MELPSTTNKLIIQEKASREVSCRFGNSELAASDTADFREFVLVNIATALAMLYAILALIDNWRKDDILTNMGLALLIPICIGLLIWACNYRSQQKKLYARAMGLILNNEPVSKKVFCDTSSNRYKSIVISDPEDPSFTSWRNTPWELRTRWVRKYFPELLRTPMIIDVYLDPETKRPLATFHDGKLVWFI